MLLLFPVLATETPMIPMIEMAEELSDRDFFHLMPLINMLLNPFLPLNSIMARTLKGIWVRSILTD